MFLSFRQVCFRTLRTCAKTTLWSPEYLSLKGLRTISKVINYKNLILINMNTHMFPIGQLKILTVAGTTWARGQ